MVFALVFDMFQPSPNSKVPGSRPNPRVQIFPPEYLGTYALCIIRGYSKFFEKAIYKKFKNLERTVELKMFRQFIKFRINSMIYIASMANILAICHAGKYISPPGK
jgi:hypothetical protein